MTSSMSRILILVFLLAPAALGAGEEGLSREDAYTLFSRANEAFRAANETADAEKARELRDRAILCFDRIINEGGIRNPKLYYNLANTYFLNGDIGRAILNYRRAERLDSADADVKKNLAFAAARRLDRVEAATEQRVLHTLFFWHYDIGTEARFAAACVFFALMCAAAAIMIWKGAGAPQVFAAAVAAVLAVSMAASVLVESRSLATRECGVITAAEVVARQGDGTGYQASFKEPLHAGTEFDVLEKRPGWLHVRLADGSGGWIPAAAAELI